MIAVEFVNTEVVLKESDWVYRGPLIDEDHVLAVSMCLSPGETKDACVRIS